MQQITFEQLPTAIGQLFHKLDQIETLISSWPSAQPEEDSLLNVQQAAELLDLSTPTIYGLVHKAQIPVCKRGKRLYFSKKELNDWIMKGRRKTLSELQNEANEYLNTKTKRG